MKAIRPDDQDLTTIEHIRDGLTTHGKLDRGILSGTEWVRNGIDGGYRTVVLHI